MELEKKEENGFFRLKINGEVDASSSLELDKEIRALLDARKQNLLFDCTNLSYISSAGLGVFVSYVQTFKEKKGKFALSTLQPDVKDVFRLLGLDQVLTILDQEKEAIAYLNEK